MVDYLDAARAIARSVRYAGDPEVPGPVGLAKDDGTVRDGLYREGVRISQDVTPELHTQLSQVCQRLGLPLDAVDPFVSSSAVVQAECYLGSSDRCVLRFSSALVDILEPDEFAFVVGHEVGHLLLGHGLKNPSIATDSLEHFLAVRAAEISADRIGFLGCGSLDVAIRALMKTVSGLTSRHLRFDVGAFLAQLRAISSTSTSPRVDATHPLIAVRCRALLWYSLADHGDGASRLPSKGTLAPLDRRIAADLDRYVDGPARVQIQSAREEVLMWFVADAATQDGSFDRAEQRQFASRFGDSALGSLRGFLADQGKEQVREAVTAKLQEAIRQFKSLVPGMAVREMPELHREANRLLERRNPRD
jgi:hypothetical protein